MADSPAQPQDGAAPAGAGPWPFSTRTQLIAGFVMAFSNFMVLLDMTVANVSVPHIAGNLGITLEQGTWVITSYAVAEAICVPLTGWLSDRFGVVRVYVAAMAAFGLFSLACGLSPTLGLLVAARIGQGFAGAPLMPISQAMMIRVFPPERRAKAMGVWAMTVLVAPAMGPILGGYISDSFSWHWIFLINVPIAIACSTVGAVVLRPAETEKIRKPIDRVGLALLVFWIGCLQIMLDIGRDRDWFADWRVAGLGIAAVIGLCVFVIWELTEEHPIVDIRIFRNRGYAMAVIMLSVCFSAYFASIVVIPQWLQSTQGYTAQDAGMVTAWTGCMSFLAAMFLPKILEKVDLRIPVFLGVGWFAIQSLNRSRWTTGLDFWTLSEPQILQGFAMPLFIMPLTQMAMAAVKPGEVASAAGIQNFTRTLAVAIATSLTLTDWSDEQRIKHAGFADTIRPAETMQTLAQSGMSTQQARTIVDNLVNEQAVTLAMTHTFLISAGAAVLAMGLVWFMPKVRSLARMDAAH